MKANDDDADLSVDGTNKSNADDLAEKDHHAIEIDLMQDTIRKHLLIDQYRDLCGEDHGHQSPNSDQKDTMDDESDIVDKEDDETGDKDDMDVDEDEDESLVPEYEPDGDNEEYDVAVCDHE
jgi:hypothetical protein